MPGPQLTTNQAYVVGSRLLEIGLISGERPLRNRPPVTFDDSIAPADLRIPADDLATADESATWGDVFAETSCKNCNDHNALMDSAVSLASVSAGCFFREYCIEEIKEAEIPKNYWNFSVSQMRYTKVWDGSNGIVLISGPVQNGKTALLSAAMVRCIVIDSVRHLAKNGPHRSHLFVEGPREFRSLASFGPDNVDAAFMYDVKVLAIDDLDKVEPRHYHLVRDVIVHREQNGLQTFVSVTNAELLREFDAQVYRRVENGTLLTLRQRDAFPVPQCDSSP